MNISSRRRVLSLAVALGLAGGATHAQTAPQLRFSGFGTLGVVHSSDRNADFVSSGFQPNGAGFSRSTAFGPDSKLAGQLDATFSPQWSAVVQVVAQHRFDNSYTPEIEWANVRYEITPEWSVRAGRTPAPFLLLSDTRMVGYAQPWVRPPLEVYANTRTRNDGADAVWRKRFGGVENTLQGFVGGASINVPGGKARSRHQWGFNDSVRVGDLTVRAGFAQAKVDIDYAGLQTLDDSLAALATLPAPFGAQAAALAGKYDPRGQTIRTISAGMSYDPGQWFVMAEALALDNSREGSVMPDTRGAYVSGGYRFGAFTPYATYARQHNDTFTEAGLPLPAAAPLNAALNAISTRSTAQSTVSVGVRWDAVKNAAVKLQYDHVKLGSNSVGQFVNVQPGFQSGGRVNLLSATLDFIF